MPRTSSPTKLQLWRDRFEQFNQSQQTVQQFCQSLGCTPATFHYWQRKLEPVHETTGHSEVASGLVKSSAFVPVVLRGGSSSPIVVRVKDGTRVSVPADALAALEIVLRHARQVAS
jgi:hypothetical protein